MRFRAASVLSVLAGLTLSAAALALPPIVDRCPKDAMLVIAIPNFDALQKDVDNMAKLIGRPLPMDFKNAMMAMGIDKGIKTDGSAAIVMFAPKHNDAAKAKPKDEMAADDDEDGEEPPTVAIIPTTDYAALLSNFNAKPGEKGKVDALSIQGKDVFCKDIGGGFAAIGPVKELVEGFSGAEGNKAAFESLVGPAGSALADKADLSVIINMAVARPIIDASMKKGMEEMADQIAQRGGAEPSFDSGTWAVQGFLDDSRGAVAAVNIDNLGASLDMVMAFKEGSRWAKLSSIAGKAGELLGKLPAGPFLVAGAIDLSSPDLKAWLKEYADKAPKKDAPVAANPFLQNLEKNDGGSFVIGFSPAGVMGGLFSQSVIFTATSDPGAAIDATHATFTKMQNDKLATVKWAEGEKEVAGVKVDSFEARMAPDPTSPLAGPMGPMLWGPSGGPSGYIAKVDGGVLMTLSKNSTLMGSALASAKGEKSLGQEKVLSQVSGMLPKGRVAEGYLGVKGVLDSILPALAMFGAPVPNVDIPQNLPPLAFALTPRSGSIHATMYLPAPTIKVASEVYKEMAVNFGGGGEVPPAPRPGKKEETGQPGF